MNYKKLEREIEETNKLLIISIEELKSKDLLICELEDLISEVEILNNRRINQKLINRIIKNRKYRLLLDKLVKYNDYVGREV